MTPQPDPLRAALAEAFLAMDAACKWIAGETAGIKTIADADRHIAGYDALLDATVKAGQAAGLLSGGKVPVQDEPGLDAELRRLSEAASPGPYVFNGYPVTLAGADAEFAIVAANYVRERFRATPARLGAADGERT
jgi:hypothetical protein